MIPFTISGRSVSFFAGCFFTVFEDHPYYDKIMEMLRSGVDDADELAKIADVQYAVEQATAGHVKVTEGELVVDGEVMPAVWHDAAIANPESTRFLLIKPGQQIRVEGDEEAPDGVYTVSAVDNEDVAKRIYIETDEGFFGFVANDAIKEVINA